MPPLWNSNGPFLGQNGSFYDNRKRSAQWLGHDEGVKNFPKPELHQQKIMATVPWSDVDVMHYSLQGSNQSITAEDYFQQLYEMRIQLSQMRPVLVNRRCPIRLQENIRSQHCQDDTAKAHRLRIRDISALFNWSLAHWQPLFILLVNF